MALRINLPVKRRPHILADVQNNDSNFRVVCTASGVVSVERYGGMDAMGQSVWQDASPEEASWILSKVVHELVNLPRAE